MRARDIVIPDREIPGSSAKDCAIPIQNAIINTISLLALSLEKYVKLMEESGLKVAEKYCLINRGNVEGIKSLIPYENLMNPNNILLPRLDQKIIWAADVSSMKTLFAELDVYGSKIGVLKLHIDTFSDFSIENLLKLQQL